MCGIAGMISFGIPFTERTALRRMCDAIAHRGPDDEGYALFNRDGAAAIRCFGAATAAAVRSAQRQSIDRGAEPFTVGLGHRRFPIIDLSAHGHQPYFDETGRWCMVYNGEIYNYKEIRARLAEKGVRFVTSSDTEVALAAFATWGPECFNEFNGFWALAIYDRKNDTVVVSRDRAGKKPLFYTRVGDRLYFASEIKALLTVEEVAARRQLNGEVAWSWLAYGKKNLDDATFFKDIFLFPKASYAMVNRNGMGTPVRFWTLPGERLKAGEMPVATACRTLRELLHDAVSLRLRSDVPVGLELSGGLDSSVIAASVGAAGVKLPAYCIRFPGKMHDESMFARSAAQRHGLPFRILDPDNGNFWKHIGAFTRLEEEPYHLPNLFSNQEIWSIMRAEGIKVSLNGAGGDESFAGYASHFWCVQNELLFSGKLHHFISNALHYSERENPLLRIAGFPLYIGARTVLDRLPMIIRPYRFKNTAKRPAFRTPFTLTQRLRTEMDRSLMPYWLVSGDRGYMGIPIELREPFLDYRVVEFAFRLPPEYLVRDGWHKWILRKAFEDELPAEVVWRKRKMGFPFPLRSFLEENRESVAVLMGKSVPGLTLRRPVHLLDWKAISFCIWYSYFIEGNLDAFAAVEQVAAGGGAPDEEAFAPTYWSMK